ncbi:hypothetical protein M758_UG254000 [Ceratodon purpureus]|nr:hypothetical protein M758_UG254000 [Ceratodon purpureus]
MDFSEYVRGCRDLSPSFSTSDDTYTSHSDSTNSNFSSLQQWLQYPRAGNSHKCDRMTSPYSRGSALFPARRLQDDDIGPGFSNYQADPQHGNNVYGEGQYEDDFELRYVRDDFAMGKRESNN